MTHITDLDIEPSAEGRTYIAIGPGSRTRLGRLLANEACTPFVHPQLGSFNSLEGYWAFVSAGGVKQNSRAEDMAHEVSGAVARRLTLHTSRLNDPHFRKLICEGLSLKIEQTPELRLLLQENGLDLVRCESLDDEVFINPNQKWFMDHLHAIAKRLKCRTPTTKKLQRH